MDKKLENKKKIKTEIEKDHLVYNKIEKDHLVYNKILGFYGIVNRKKNAFIYVETKNGTIARWKLVDCKLIF